MPVTRSQKDAPSCAPSRSSTAGSPSERTESTEATSGSSATTTSTETTTTATEGTFVAETTATLKTSNTAEAKKDVIKQKKMTTQQRNQEDAPVQSNQSTTATIVPVVASRRPGSTKTTSSSTRRRELEAKEELARLELEQAQAATKLARIRMDLADCEDEDSMDDEDLEERTAQVQNWIQTSVIENKNQEAPEKQSQHPPENQKATKYEENNEAKESVRTLADAIKEVLNSDRRSVAQPKYIHELPYFDGNSSEWLAFKIVYEDTASMFTEGQNMARLRRAIKGGAREAIKSLLYSEASPSEVMQALQRRYGRPDALVMAELEKVKTLPRITENPKDICVFASQVNNSVASIKGLKKPQYLHSPEMIKQIIEKMPTILRFRWYDFTAANEDSAFSNLELVSKFLNIEADKCGAFATIEEKTNYRRVQRQAAHVTTSREKTSCPVCEGDHFLSDCLQFKKMSIQDRWTAVKQSRVCFKCLLGRHRKESCRKPSCRVCRRWHHHLLHVDVEQTRKIATNEKETPNEKATNITAPVNAVKEARAYLKMTPIEVYGPKGSIKIMALLDEGSTVSLIDAAVAEQIGATGDIDELTIETVGGKLIKKKNSERLDLTVRGTQRNKKCVIRQVRTVDNLKLTPQHLSRKKIEECAHLKKLADNLYYEASSPQLLIGQDNWQLIVSRTIRKGKPGQPVASRTELGWVLHGFDSNNVKPVNFLHNCHHISATDEDMHQLIRDHFNIEALGVQPRRPTTDAEGRAIAILTKTCRRLENGRFEAGLLWKNEDLNSLEMPESYSSAANRLKNIEKKLDKDASLKKEYNKQMQHLIDSSYAEEAPEKCKSKRKWYLPHFPVTHPVKRKIRIVFDAAAKSGGRSLNDALLPGPDLLQSLFGVLVRFRQGPIAVAADIKEMFLQIKVREEDRDSLRFLWRGAQRDAPIKEYRMTSVVFGATSSPSTAIYVKNRNAMEYQAQYPEAVKAIEVNHYMDDYLQSFHTEEQFKKITSEVDKIHKKAGFELRGWASNRPELLKTADGKTEVEIGEHEEKTLGLRWYTERDSIGFRADLQKTPEEVLKGYRTPTKREVTSAVMSTFDPLGLVSPILIQGKKLLQKIWRSGVGWDEDIQASEQEDWKSYLINTKTIQDLDIPRCIAPYRTEGELHVFADASETAYAAAVYWRTEDVNGDVAVNLVAAKARVTPLKPVSIPRLELQAALLGTRLAQSVESELQLQVKKKTYWSDSSIVLSWIKTDPRSFKTFVAHRLAEIEDTTKPQDWRWIPSSQNPADDATRRVPENFTHKHRWFNGPEFLRKPENEWPAPRSFKKEVTGEEKVAEVVTAVKRQQFVINPEKFSSWKRLWRTTARVLQFIEKCRPKESVNACRNRNDPTWSKQKKPDIQVKRQQSLKKKEQYTVIGAEILKKAEKLLLKQSQEECFSEELQRLRQNKSLEGGSKLKRFDVEIENEIVHLKGRIDAMQGVTRDYKRPIVLDSKSRIVVLIIDDYHRRFNHANHATVMNELRQRFWILGLRSALKTVQHQCQWCKVNKNKPREIPIGNLPAERLRYGAPPFTCTGVDYFGPMTVTVARRHEKRWGALFTCLTTRAVHMELVPSLSTDSMLMALRRLAARRGMPQIMYSDNGTNFVGGNKELTDAVTSINSEMSPEAEKIGVQWKFIPPGAPNMGGAWERLVRSIKTALDVTLKERHPKEEVLHTLLLEAEHIVNSRPLTHLAENLNEEALTPNHFLIGRSCGAAKIGDFHDSELIGRDTWKTTQRLADHFWQRWVREYLPTLLPRKLKRNSNTDELQVGDVVLIVDANLPRCTWPRGKILKTYTGPDARTRIVDVETRGGVLRRPSSRIVLLVRGSPRQEDGASHEGENVGDQTSEPSGAK